MMESLSVCGELRPGFSRHKGKLMPSLLALTGSAWIGGEPYTLPEIEWLESKFVRKIGSVPELGSTGVEPSEKR